MAYVRNGQVVQSSNMPFTRKIIALLASIVDFIVFFFRTIWDPSAVEEMERKRSRRGAPSGSSFKPGGGGGGGGGGRPTGPRISGLSQLRDASGNCAAGA